MVRLLAESERKRVGRSGGNELYPSVDLHRDCFDRHRLATHKAREIKGSSPPNPCPRSIGKDPCWLGSFDRGRDPASKEHVSADKLCTQLQHKEYTTEGLSRAFRYTLHGMVKLFVWVNTLYMIRSLFTCFTSLLKFCVNLRTQ